MDDHIKPLAPTANPDFRQFADAQLKTIAMAFGVPAIIPAEYSNPFSILSEFEQWWEFARRKHFEKESSWSIIRDMLAEDPERAHRAIDSNYTSMRLHCDREFGRLRRPLGQTGIRYGSA